MTFFCLEMETRPIVCYNIFIMSEKKRLTNTAQKLKFTIKDLPLSSLRIWSHLLKKPLMEYSVFWCSETFKSSDCKDLYLQCLCYWYNLLRWMSLLRHCVKNVLIRSCSGPHFPTFGLNTESYEKLRTRIAPNTGAIHAGCVVTGMHHYSCEFIIALWFSEAPCCCFLWRKCFERSPYFVRYLQNNRERLI